MKSSLLFDLRNSAPISAWHGFWRNLSPPCSHSDCAHTRGFWRRLRCQPRGVVIQGRRYCSDDCGERALADALRRIDSAPAHATHSTVVPHRVPLGLLLLSRQQLTADQLRTALGAQRKAGRGRIGEWLLAFGFVNDHQVTAALARQWSCPVLRTNSFVALTPIPGDRRTPQIPLTLLESFLMIPVNYVESTDTLHIAFGEGIDHSVLYAIEQIVGCRTESCMAVPSFVRQHLSALSRHRGESEMIFDRVADGAEFLRIVHSYRTRLSASEVRLAACGPHLWVRLLRPSAPALDLLLRLPWGVSPRAAFPAYSLFPSAL